MDVAGRAMPWVYVVGTVDGIPDELEVAWRVTPTLALRDPWELLRKN